MNILILHGSSDLYGASKIVLATVGILRKHGHTPIVVLTSHGPLVHELEAIGVEVRKVQLGILRRKYYSLPGLFNRIIVLRKAHTALQSIIREKNIGLVYSNTTAVLAGAFAAKATGTRHIWHVHEIIEQPRWLAWFLGNMLNRYSEKVIVVSNAVQKSWGRYVSAEKLKRIYNGIDDTPYRQPSDQLRKELQLPHTTLVIGMVGRVHSWKGQGYFIRIASQLAGSFSNIHFVMIGDAFPGYEYLYEELDQLKQTEGVAGLISNLGYRTDVAGLLQGFDIFVLPSTLPDPLPTVVLEAMASGLPVVATRHGGAAEMVTEGETGLLIPVNQPAEAAKAISALLINSELRQKMGRAGRQKVLAQFSPDMFEKEMINLLE